MILWNEGRPFRGARPHPLFPHRGNKNMPNNSNSNQVLADAPPLPAPVFFSLSEHTPDGINTFPVGGTTQDVNPVLVFGGIVGDTYTLYDNGLLVGTMTATKDASGWILPTLSEGPHNLVLTYTTDAGKSAPLIVNFTVDTSLVIPAITSVVDNTGPL